METSTCPPRIMANDSEESKHEAPGTSVTVSLPALTISLPGACQQKKGGKEGIIQERHSRVDLALGGIRTHPENTVLRLDPDFSLRR